MSLTCGLFTQVSDLGPHGPFVCCCKTYVVALIISAVFREKRGGIVITEDIYLKITLVVNYQNGEPIPVGEVILKKILT